MELEIIDRTEAQELREIVRKRYGQSALMVKEGAASCCGPASGGGGCCGAGAVSGVVELDKGAITGNLYSAEEASAVPLEAYLASLGCGNPTALARLNPGETVLDLGSGGGIDVLLSAKRVGPTGFAYGLDMTDEMLALAEENRVKAGVDNVRFLKGYIEEIPLPDNSVDVIISNCVINLSADKGRVLREAYRVLKPGGRFAVSDIVVTGEAPEAIRKSVEAWTGCIGGALHVDDYKALLTQAGFEEADVEITRRYTTADLSCEGGCSIAGEVSVEELEQADGLFASGFIRGMKPMDV
jgi:SAM-dependent methyltransferase